MLNIFKEKQNNLLPQIYFKQNFNKTQNRSERNEYKKIIYYPSSSKEWSNSVYSYNKSYSKPLVAIDFIINNLFTSYFNILQDKITILFKRRRDNKSRYSANKIYLSKAELKHTNTKLIVILYMYNKQKLSFEQFTRRLIKIRNLNKKLVESEIKNKKTSKNRLIHLIKNNFFSVRKWGVLLFKQNNNLFKNIPLSLDKWQNILKKKLRYHIILMKRIYKLQQLLYDTTKLINFNKSKFNTLVLNSNHIGLTNIIQKIYNKKVEIRVVELKSIHLNSDLFSSAIALKLKDRKNKVLNILRKAILQMVKIPDLHTLITFDNSMEYTNRANGLSTLKILLDSHNSKQTINKKNILNMIKQQTVTGVRLEASGRLTRRLTAMRSVFKYRYVGGLKNIRSSFNNKSSTMLRGYVKSNSQYTLINSKTRNGSFGLKTWVSSH